MDSINSSKKTHTPLICIVYGILAVLPFFLIFNNNIWFDEAYTLALIKHSYGDIISILKSDMHPPLYFISLKAFCDIFGYSMAVTKIFSILGYEASLILGVTLIKKHFGQRTSALYLLITAAVPMNFYFSVQQRSYSWSFFFVALCFVSAVLVIRHDKLRYYVLLVIAGLFAGYNHIFSLLAISLIFAFTSFYYLFKKTKYVYRPAIADAAAILGYFYWIIPLFQQTGKAAGNFWLTGVDPYSVASFVFGIVVSAALMIKKENRNIEMIFAVFCVLGIQAVGLGITLLYKPLYIARYGSVIMGVFVFMTAFGLTKFSSVTQKIICLILTVSAVLSYCQAISWEYDNSAESFIARNHNIISDDDAFLYADNSCGVAAYYYPDNPHYCINSEDWYSAFGNVDCVSIEEALDKLDGSQRVWYVKVEKDDVNERVQNNFRLTKKDSFHCDKYSFELYEAEPVNNK